MNRKTTALPKYNPQKRDLRLLYTDFNRTVADALANEAIWDMQDMIEAISHYYYRNGENFEGVSVAPEYQKKCERLTDEAIEYYGN